MLSFSYSMHPSHQHLKKINRANPTSVEKFNQTWKINLPLVGHPNERRSFNSLFLVKWRLGPEKLELFLMTIIMSLSFKQFCIKTHSFLFFRPSHLHVVRNWVITLFYWASLLFVRREIPFFQGCCVEWVNEHSINAGFYDVIEPRHYVPSINTLSQTYWCTSTVHSLVLPLPCATDWIMTSALLSLMSLQP